MVVTAGGYAHISGTTPDFDGDRPSVGSATLTGICNGAVVNDGGHVKIHGLVEGPIIEHAGWTVIAPDASVLPGRSPEA